jgi:RNA polymerase sigma factor (TIGR02999 family)
VSHTKPQEVTQLLLAWSHGDRAALDRLIPLVATELHRLAHHYMRRERAGHTLQTTALVNEAYVRLVDASRVEWRDRAHFFAVSANLMRRILVDFARKRQVQKRGADALVMHLDADDLPGPQPAPDIVALDAALEELARVDPRAANIVELRFFGGLTVDETAEVVGVSPRTIKREWSAAKAWLLGEMTSAGT